MSSSGVLRCSALVALSFAACSGDDSADVQRASPAASQWAQSGGAWTVSPEAELILGATGGGVDFERIVAAYAVADTQLVVVDGGASNVSFFSWRGDRLRAVGRAGNGPGEFRNIVAAGVVHRDAPVVAVYDHGLGRVSFLSARGDLLATGALPTAAREWVPVPIGFVDAETLVALHWRLPRPIQGASSGLVEDSAAIVEYEVRWGNRSAEVAMGDTVSVVPHWRAFKPSTLPLMVRVPFTPQLKASVREGHIAYSFSDSLCVSYRSVDAEWRTCLDAAPQDVSESDKERFRQVMAASVVDETGRPFPRDHADEWVEVRYEEAPFPERMPAHGAIVVDQLGNVWISEYDPAGAIAADPIIGARPSEGGWDDLPTTNWNVLDRTGAWLGVVTLPAALAPTDIGRDYVVGVYTDSLEVESLRRYTLVKPSANTE